MMPSFAVMKASSAGLLLLLLAAAAHVVCSEQDSGSGVDEARLLASKFLLSNYAVEKKDFVVDYNIYNVGQKAAIHVALNDNSFPSTMFEVVRGLLSVKWDRIPPGGNVSHAVVLRPITYGYHNYTPAEVTYTANEDTGEERRAFTTSAGDSYIYLLKDYERRFAPRFVDWSIFGLMTLPSLAMPYFLWKRTSSKYEAIASQKKYQ